MAPTAPGTTAPPTAAATARGGRTRTQSPPCSEDLVREAPSLGASRVPSNVSKTKCVRALHLRCMLIVDSNDTVVRPRANIYPCGCTISMTQYHLFFCVIDGGPYKTVSTFDASAAPEVALSAYRPALGSLPGATAFRPLRRTKSSWPTALRHQGQAGGLFSAADSVRTPLHPHVPARVSVPRATPRSADASPH